ncbi:MAG: ribonuclease HII [Candidatus Gribaldobacteria bacterium]|nr:ribonuclease HII [Candidatus Gribaldobacteria bacterium]
MNAKKQKIVFGIDEVGRGSLAGPVMACAIVAELRKLKELGSLQQQGTEFHRDSKRLSPKQREEIYEILKKDPSVEWGIGKVSEKVIDKINIFQATKLAMEKAVLALEKKIGQPADMLLIDGNFGIGLARSQQSIIKGDEKIFLISLASIIAKVERDRLMTRLHCQYPQYGFNQHKGYGAKQHLLAIEKFGPCPLHRQSFSPIKTRSYCQE